MAVKIQIRGDTALTWATINPTLAERELAVETDTGKFKVGNGINTWLSLPYLGFVAANADEATKGIVEEATDAEVFAASTTGGTGAKLFITPAKLATALAGLIEDRVAVAVSGGTLTLNVNSQRQRNFDLTTTLSGNFTLAFTNTSNWVRSRLTLRLTGTSIITMPAAVIMDSFEYYNSRWNYTSNLLTIVGATASPFVLEFVPDSSGNIWCFATNNGL